MAAGEAAPPAQALTLDALPPLALTLVLSAPSLLLADVARAACVCRALRAAASSPALPQWGAVRVVGRVRKMPDEEAIEVRRG